MTTIDTRLVRLGMREPRAALVEQGLASEGLAKDTATDINKFGWSEAKSKAVRGSIETLQSTMAVQADQRDDSGTSHDGEVAALSAAKKFIRHVRFAWPMAHRDAAGKAGVGVDAIESGGTIGKSTPKTVAYLTTLAPAVKALEPWLLPYFAGVSPSATLLACRTALEGADRVQETELDQIPEATQRIYEAKGRLVELIGDLNRIGCMAFDGQAVTRARFNKDVLLRGRKVRTPKS